MYILYVHTVVHVHTVCTVYCILYIGHIGIWYSLYVFKYVLSYFVCMYKYLLVLGISTSSIVTHYNYT